MAWKSVDLPTLARPTWSSELSVNDAKLCCVGFAYIRYRSSSCYRACLAGPSSPQQPSSEASFFLRSRVFVLGRQLRLPRPHEEWWMSKAQGQFQLQGLKYGAEK